jgi:FkbM family methyltransferase
MVDGTKVVVPRSLNAISTYVLLEQERWFEKEIDFVSAFLQPGMTAIDIGANVGVYALSMARRVGPAGQVYAFEPSRQTRAMLDAGVSANSLTNVIVSAAAVSDRVGEAVLGHGASSELHSLTTCGPGESVALTSLDAEDASGRWSRIDFVKLDAEGVEDQILTGGLEFFKRQAPIVMFEVTNGDRPNTGLMARFQSLGFVLFRSLPGVPVLVPLRDGEPLDPFDLNLFAVPKSRLTALAEAGVLTAEPTASQPSAVDLDRAARCIKETAFFGAFKSFWPLFSALPDAYQAGLASYVAWRAGDQDWTSRYSALLSAVTAFATFAKAQPSCAALAMLARAQWEAGQRGHALGSLRRLAELIATGDTSVPVPFWPALARFDGVDPGTQPATWLRVSSIEQLERVSSFSSLYHSTVDLDALAAQPFAHIEMERRRMLLGARAGAANGRIMDVPKRLWPISPDHRNGQIWRHGQVPNTRRRS